MATLQTRFQTMTSGTIDGYSNFKGNDTGYRDWLNVIGQSRDSKPLERSNFQVALKRLGGEGNNVILKRFKHWGCGWLEEVYVRPNTPEVVIAQKIADDIENNSILDEDHFYKIEQEDANETWKNCYSPKDRMKYIRENATDFQFEGIKDILQCVRGLFFGGCPANLI